MSAQIPTVLIGKNVSAAAITGEVPAVNGVLSAGVTYNLKTLGTLDHFEYSGSFNGEDVHPVDAAVTNFVGTVDDFEVTVGEIELADGSSSLMSIWGTYNYLRFAIAFTPTGGSQQFQFAAIVTRAGGNIRKGIVEGKNAVLATFKPCGILPYWGTGTPSF